MWFSKVVKIFWLLCRSTTNQTRALGSVRVSLHGDYRAIPIRVLQTIRSQGQDFCLQVVVALLT